MVRIPAARFAIALVVFASFGCGSEPTAADVGADAGADVLSDATADADVGDTATSDTATSDAGTGDASADVMTDVMADARVDADATGDVGVDAPPDVDASADAGGDRVTRWGWYATGFELAAFVPDEEGPIDGLDTCNVYVVDAGDDGETWWIEGGDGAGLGRVIHPGHPTTGYERMGRVRLTGALSEPGTWGHMGAYERAIDVVRHELDVCGSVAETGHCLTPAPGDLCQFGVDWDGGLTASVVEEVPGVDDQRWHFVLQLRHGADVPDGETRLDVRLSVPQPEAWPEDGRLVYPLASIEFGAVTETGYGVFVAEYDVTVTDGWLVVDRSRDALQFSWSLASDGGLLDRVWGDAVIDDVVYFP